MQEEKTTKDFCNKIQLFLQKGVGFSQAGKGDGQGEVTALTTAIKAGGVSLWQGQSKTAMQIGLCCVKSSFLYVTYCLH